MSLEEMEKKEVLLLCQGRKSIFFKKWLDRLANALKRFAGKAVEALPPIIRSVIGSILSFLSKTVVAFAGLIGL